MPTGGVEAGRESLEAWFAAGVACVGMGSNLITKEAVAARDFAGIARKVAQVIAWIRQVRPAAP
jgi:2-dehydro-3-deoxyphosphogluconate aldolase/(4S)-4-hydroxy-2-oxoglutarate aldolase